MKTLAVFAIFWCLTQVLNGQIILEQTYNHSGSLAEIDDNEFKYFVMDVPLEQCRLYNTDHTIYKTISLPVPAEYYLYDLKYISRHIFNNDDNIELLYIYSRESEVNGQSVSSYGLKVVSETGETLLNLADGAYAEIHTVDDKPRLMTWQYIWYDAFYLIYTNVYTLGGKFTKSVTDLNAENFLLFPNPVKENLNIEFPDGFRPESGMITISDVSGKEIIKHSYSSSPKRITLPARRLIPGTYIVSVTTKEGRQISKLLEKSTNQ